MITNSYLKAMESTLDDRDKDLMERLADREKCQARMVADGGAHYVYCGGYNKDRTVTLQPNGRWACRYHRHQS